MNTICSGMNGSKIRKLKNDQEIVMLDIKSKSYREPSFLKDVNNLIIIYLIPLNISGFWGFGEIGRAHV